MMKISLMAAAIFLVAICGGYSRALAQSNENDSWQLDSIEVKTGQNPSTRVGLPSSVVVGLTGSWSGTYRNDKGESGYSIINLVEHANGVLTGDEAGWKIKHGRRVGNVLTWQYPNQAHGCRDYQVRLELSDDGKVLTGTYTVKDRCAGPANYSGQYLKYLRQ